MLPPLLELTDCGLTCALGGFTIDPWRPVERAIITHAHSDHARWGSRHYLAHTASAPLLRQRLGDISLQTLAYHEPLKLGAVTVTLYPAGHILGSAQVCVEYQGERWVVSGDYKTEADTTCVPFEPVRCNVFVSECTFGLPIYRWQPQAEVFAEIGQWWQANQAMGLTSILYCYALGKAQRILAGVDAGIGPIVVHGAVHAMNEAYRQAGVNLPPTHYLQEGKLSAELAGRSLVLAPPSADGTPWLRKFGDLSTGFASGWMQVRGARRRRGVDRGFVLSDHVDWPELHRTLQATGAHTFYLTHGYVQPVVNYLKEQGRQAYALHTEYEGELGSGLAATEPAAQEEALPPLAME